MSARWIKGKVRWFDSSSGRGVIDSHDGKSFNVHYSAIQSKKKWKSLKENRSVEFQVLPDPDYSVVLKVKEVGR